MEQWIKWNGQNNEPPKGVKFWDRVEILMRSGYKNEGDANFFVWGHFNTESDIIFFRVIETEDNRQDIL